MLSIPVKEWVNFKREMRKLKQLLEVAVDGVVLIHSGINKNLYRMDRIFEQQCNLLKHLGLLDEEALKGRQVQISEEEAS